MAIIIETCPKCGHDLVNEMICTYPPIPRKSCPSCGWSWECEREEVIRVPFGGNSLSVNTTDYLSINGNSTTTTTISINDLNNYNLENSIMGNWEQPACVNCPNNAKNGGSGICCCVLGQVPVT